MANSFKTLLLPPYQPLELYSIFITLFIVTVLPLLVLELSIGTQNQATNSSAVAQSMSVQITLPDSKNILSGTKTILLEARDQNPITSVNLLVGDTIYATIHNPNFSNHMLTKLDFDSTQFKNGEKSLTASATNNLDESSSSPTAKVIIANSDNLSPVVSFEDLTDGSLIKSAQMAIKINASDDAAIDKVKLSIDGQLVKTFTNAPFNYTWALSGVKSGTHKLSATASDLTGNTKTTEISIFKFNP